MKYLVAFLFLAIAPAALAFNIQILEPERPYAPQIAEYTAGEQTVLLGSLEDYPIMYQLVVKDESELELRLRQSSRASAEPIPFSLIAVKQSGTRNGVAEVGRITPKPEEWNRIKDSNFGMSFREAEALIVSVEPGVYNIEVSTAINEGKYMLLLGNQENKVGYFDSISDIRATQKFFGYSIFSMLTVAQIYYPIGITLLLFAIHRTWKHRKKIAHVD